MNHGNRKLLAALVAQRLEMGEREWYFNPLPLLSRDGAERSRISAGTGREMTDRADTGGIENNAAASGCSGTVDLAGKSSLEALKEAVQGCMRCELGEKRNSFVFGDGDPGADVMFVGPTDLSYNLGIRDQLESPQFVAVLQKVSDAARKNGKAAGILVHNNALVPKCRDLGYTFMALGSDGGAVRAGLLGLLAALRAK